LIDLDCTQLTPAIITRDANARATFGGSSIGLLGMIQKIWGLCMNLGRKKLDPGSL
jgi:hypothetical protein